MKKSHKVINIILINICLFLLIGLTLSVVMRNFLNQKNIYDTIKNNDMSFFLNDLNEDKQLLLDEIKETFKILGLKDNTIEEVLNSDGTKNFISIYLSNTLNYFFKNEKEIPIKKEDLKNLIQSNMSIIESNLSQKEKDYINKYEQQLYNYIDEHADEIIGFFPMPEQLLNQVNQQEVMLNSNVSLQDVTKTISTLISLQFIYLLIAIITLIVIILIIINRFNYKWADCLKKITLSYSFIMIALEILLGTVIKSMAINISKSTSPILNYLVNNISQKIWIWIITAITLTIIFYVLLKREEKKNNHEKIYN